MIGTTNVPGGLSASQVTSQITLSNVADMVAKMNNVQSVLIPASDWTEDQTDGYYKQTVSILGYNNSPVTAQDKPEIYFNKSNVAFDDAEDYVEQCGYIMSIETGANCLNLVAYEPPTLNITIDVKGV